MTRESKKSNMMIFNVLQALLKIGFYPITAVDIPAKTKVKNTVTFIPVKPLSTEDFKRLLICPGEENDLRLNKSNVKSLISLYLILTISKRY